MSSSLCVLVVADPGRIAELATALGDPFPQGAVDVLVSTGGDDTIDLFESRAPRVVVLTASLETGDAKSLIETLRDMVPRHELSIVLIGDDDGPVRNALDAIDMKPDRFVSRPLSMKALRFAVQSGLEMVARALGEPGTEPSPDEDIITAPRPAATQPRGSNGASGHAVLGEHVSIARAITDRGIGISSAVPATGGAAEPQNDAEFATRAALRARWGALADSIGNDHDDAEEGHIVAGEPPHAEGAYRADQDLGDIDELDSSNVDAYDAAPPPIEISPRRKGSTDREFKPVPQMTPWRPGGTAHAPDDQDVAPPAREPTLILHDEIPPDAPAVPSIVAHETASTDTPDEPTRERWSHPVLLSELIDRSRDSSRELLAHVTGTDDLAGLDDIDDEIILGHPQHTPPSRELRGGKLQELEDLVEPEMPPELSEDTRPRERLDIQDTPPPQPSERPAGRDFARQLRAKMSMMAQRLFQTDTSASQSSGAVDVGPKHDHHTEIDLAALTDEPPMVEGVTEIGAGGATDARGVSTTAPGTWDTQVRERRLPESGEIVRGVSDAALVLARMFTQSFTGRVGFRKDDVEKVAYFDQGRPVFASSSAQGDRMGELLVREGKITASQYERCQVHVAQSGRRMGEILVDFGYLKRRELLPAVRRHVEDILYSLFGWDRGHYHITPEPMPSAERIRLSRHPASLILEGIRRKLDRTTLEKVLGPASTVIEVPDRDRVAAVLNIGDLATEERAALAAFDGQADLAHVAVSSGVDVADVLPFAWGLVVLNLAIARRAEADVVEEAALVGETDIAIDRERVHARWQLVSEADYFALLGVRRDATAFEIRRAYQAARRDFAADCFPSDLRRELARELEDIASVLDEAFRVLRDDRLRLTYLANLIG